MRRNNLDIRDVFDSNGPAAQGLYDLGEMLKDLASNGAQLGNQILDDTSQSLSDTYDKLRDWGLSLPDTIRDFFRDAVDDLATSPTMTQETFNEIWEAGFPGEQAEDTETGEGEGEGSGSGGDGSGGTGGENGPGGPGENGPGGPGENGPGGPGEGAPGENGPGGPGGNRGGPCGSNSSNPMDNPPISPLALDLTGAGLELIARENSGAVFDLNGDGFATWTAWLGSGSGFLAHDVNGNGRIDDISELFGAAAFNGPDDHGFTMLAMHDLNGDGVIDANDAVFSELLIWRDFNGDGISDEGELFTLAEMGIVSISLNAAFVDDWRGANWISHTASDLPRVISSISD